MYSTDTSFDYLYTEFRNNNEHQNFINEILNKSIHNFDTAVDTNDRVLTLSTCDENEKRLVVHAVLVSIDEYVRPY